MVQKFYRIKEVVALTGLPQSTIYQKMKLGEFPKSFSISPRLVAWSESGPCRLAGSAPWRVRQATSRVANNNLKPAPGKKNPARCAAGTGLRGIKNSGQPNRTAIAPQAPNRKGGNW